MNAEPELGDLKPSPASQVRTLLERGGIAPSEIHASISNLDVSIRERIEEIPIGMFQKSRPNAVLLLGTTGVGKSYAMAAFARLILEKRYAEFRPEHIDIAQIPLLWCSVPNLVAEWKSMSLRGTEQERLLQRYLHVEYLFLDDLGAETKERGGRDYDRGLAFIERVVRHRYDHFRPTSCTTNCTAEALILRYGAPVFSRLQHMSAWVEFPKGSRDRRLQPKRPAT